MKTSNTICKHCLHLRVIAKGEELRRVRIKNNLALREVARQVNISPAYLCDIEHNRRLPPRTLITYLQKLDEL